MRELCSFTLQPPHPFPSHGGLNSLGKCRSNPYGTFPSKHL